MSTFVDLNRATYLKPGRGNRLNYLSSLYKNIRFQIQAVQVYTLTQSDTANAPGLAFRFYGDVGYWWVICLFNGIIDPIEELVPGRTLQLPSIADVNAFLTAQDDALATSVTI